MRTAGLNQARSRRCVVDQVRTLQMEATRSDVADLGCRVARNALLDGAAPLLDVLRRCMRVEGRETDNRLPKYRLSEIERCDRRDEIVALVGLRENERDIVQLVAPG